jgi:hypothetical protein
LTSFGHPADKLCQQAFAMMLLSDRQFLNIPAFSRLSKA